MRAAASMIHALSLVNGSSATSTRSNMVSQPMSVCPGPLIGVSTRSGAGLVATTAAEPSRGTLTAARYQLGGRSYRALQLRSLQGVAGESHHDGDHRFRGGVPRRRLREHGQEAAG